MTYDRDIWQTWPIPDHGVNTRHPDVRPSRLSEYGEGWVDGWEACCLLFEQNLAEVEAITLDMLHAKATTPTEGALQ